MQIYVWGRNKERKNKQLSAVCLFVAANIFCNAGQSLEIMSQGPFFGQVCSALAQPKRVICGSPDILYIFTLAWQSRAKFSGVWESHNFYGIIGITFRCHRLSGTCTLFHQFNYVAMSCQTDSCNKVL
jgi:hypothetical protein